MNKRTYRKFSETGVHERTNAQMRRVLLVAQVLDAERAWLNSDEVHKAYTSRVGKACRRTMLRDLRLLVCAGIVEERQVKREKTQPMPEFRFEGWPLPLGG